MIRDGSTLRSSLAFFLLVACPLALTAHAASGKCLHCLGVGAELQRRLDNERPRNHLDLRHRLDSEGKRYGKVIDYKVSELRAVELLEHLCETMDKYDLLWLDDAEGWRWVKKRGDGAVDAVSKRQVTPLKGMRRLFTGHSYADG